MPLCYFLLRFKQKNVPAISRQSGWPCPLDPITPKSNSMPTYTQACCYCFRKSVKGTVPLTLKLQMMCQGKECHGDCPFDIQLSQTGSVPGRLKKCQCTCPRDTRLCRLTDGHAVYCSRAVAACPCGDVDISCNGQRTCSQENLPGRLCQAHLSQGVGNGQGPED